MNLFGLEISLAGRNGNLTALTGRIERLEEDMHSRTSKGYADDTFQRKDICEERITGLRSDVTEIKKDVKILLTRQ